MTYGFTIYTRNGVEFNCNLEFEDADKALLIAGEMAEAMGAMDKDLLSGDIKVRFYRYNHDKFQVMEKCYYLGMTSESKFVEYLREGGML